jgi:hypothetical protein
MGKGRFKGENPHNHSKQKYNNSGHGNGSGNGNGKCGMHCNNCGMNNHTTDKCFKAKKPHKDIQNKINKPKISNNHNQQTKTICTRCGRWNHEAKRCTAQALPEHLRCPCSNPYHKANFCPWGQSEDKQLQFQSKANGKICQWCKDDGDGTHDFTDCLEAPRFRSALKAEIQRRYDGLHWCWHCQAENHKTKACDKPVADLGRTAWDAKISIIVEQWVNTDMSSFTDTYQDESEDVHMTLPGKCLRAPVASDFRWCIFCQQFGHHADEATCDTTEYFSRCPARFKNAEVAKKPFIPNRYTSSSGSTNLFSNSSDNVTDNTNISTFSANSMRIKCITLGCRTQHTFTSDPRSANNDRNFCTVCQTWTRHPYASVRKDSKVELLKELRKTLESFGGITSFKKKQQIVDLYKFRPSIALPAHLALERWPDIQPKYSDGGTVPEGSDTTLFDHKDIFNKSGNVQTYFPPFLIRLTQQDREIRDNDSWPINRAGRMGLVLECVACGTTGIVRDAEGDLVMCGSDAACTVGCGYGLSEWWGTSYRDRCRCLTITGRESRPEWVAPRLW